VIDELLQVWPHATNGSSTNDVVHFAGQCDGAEEICRVHFDHQCIEAWTNAIGYWMSVDSSVNPYATCANLCSERRYVCKGRMPNGKKNKLVLGVGVKQG